MPIDIGENDSVRALTYVAIDKNGQEVYYKVNRKYDSNASGFS